MARSSGICSHSLAYGRRYSTRCSRCEPVTSWNVAAPLGQSRPREIGESRSPSMSTIFPSRTCTSWPHPTAQYGQIDLTTRSALSVRGRSSIVRRENDVVPSACGSPVRTCRTAGHLEGSGSDDDIAHASSDDGLAEPQTDVSFYYRA